MGAASRRKRERIKLTEAQFYKLKAASAQLLLVRTQAQQQIQDADRRLSEATVAAGLTVGVQYEMDEKTLSAIAVTS